MEKEEVYKIRGFAKVKLFKKYHNRYLDDLCSYLCLRRLQNPKVDLWYALLDFCRIEGITIDQNTKRGALAVAHGKEILKEPVAIEKFDPFGTIEEELLKIGRKELVCEIVNLLRQSDYSGTTKLFRIIGHEIPVKYPYEKWRNADRIAKLGNKIVKYLREHIDVEMDSESVQKKRAKKRK